MNSDDNKLGSPDIELAGLMIWIHDRQFPDTTDYWDANWLNVTVYCSKEGSNVKVNGNIIHLSELLQFLSGVKKLNKNLKGKAEMLCMEPYLSATLETGKHGHIDMAVNITPDHLHQKHTFRFEIDQSYLTKFISSCEATLEKYPIIGKP